MKRKYYFSFKFPTYEDAYRDLAKFQIAGDEGKLTPMMGLVVLQVDFPETDSRWWRWLDQFRIEGRELPLLIETIEYTKAELAAASLLRIPPPPRTRGEIGVAAGTRYDLSQACPHCWSGGRPLAPLRISRKEVPVRQVWSVTRPLHVLATGEFLTALQAIPRSGSWLKPVVEAKTGEPLPWMAIVPDVTLPKTLPSNSGYGRDTIVTQYSGPCPQCDRDCWGGAKHDPDLLPWTTPHYSLAHLRQSLGYDPEEPSRGYPDVANVWECWGDSRRPDGHQQVPSCDLVVNQRTYQVLRKYLPCAKRATPVELV
jgi:hypothetical protein